MHFQKRKTFEGDLDCHMWICLCQRKKVEVCTGALHDVAEWDVLLLLGSQDTELQEGEQQSQQTNYSLISAKP